MSNLQELKEQELKAKQQLAEIRESILEEENKTTLPERKKRYEGKYFKFRNCYSCPNDESDYWYMYIKVTKVDNSPFMQGITFQVDKGGKIWFERDKYIIESSCEKQITEEEFDTAYKNLLKNIEDIFN